MAPKEKQWLVPPPPPMQPSLVPPDPAAGPAPSTDGGNMFDEFGPQAATPVANAGGNMFDEFGPGGQPAEQPHQQPIKQNKPTAAQFKVNQAAKPAPGFIAPPAAVPPTNPILDVTNYLGNKIGAMGPVGNVLQQVGNNIAGGVQTAGNAYHQAVAHPAQAVGSALTGAAGGLVGLPEDVINAVSGIINERTGGQPKDAFRTHLRKEIEHGRIAKLLTGEGTPNATPSVQQTADFGGGMLVPLPGGSATKAVVGTMAKGAIGQGILHGLGMGAAFGATGELSREVQANEKLDAGKVAREAAVGAGTGAAMGGTTGAVGKALGGGKKAAPKIDNIPEALAAAEADPAAAPAIHEAIDQHLTDLQKTHGKRAELADTPLASTDHVEIAPVEGHGAAAEKNHSGLKLPKSLSGAKPIHGAMRAKFGDDLDLALNVVRKGNQSGRHEDYLNWIKENTGWDDAQIHAASERVAKAAADRGLNPRPADSKTFDVAPGARDYGIVRKPKEQTTPPPEATETPAEQLTNTPQPKELPSTYKEALDAIKGADENSIHALISLAEDLRPKKGPAAYVKEQQAALDQAYEHYTGLQLSKKKMADNSRPIQPSSSGAKTPEAQALHQEQAPLVNHNTAPDYKIQPGEPGYPDQYDMENHPKSMQAITHLINPHKSGTIHNAGNETESHTGTGHMFEAAANQLTDKELHDLIDKQNTELDRPSVIKSQSRTDGINSYLEILNDEVMRRETRKIRGHERNWAQEDPAKADTEHLKELDQHYIKRAAGDEMTRKESEHWQEVHQELVKRGEKQSPEELRKAALTVPQKETRSTDAGGTSSGTPETPPAEVKTAPTATIAKAPNTVPEKASTPQSAEIKPEAQAGPRFTKEKTEGGWNIIDNRPPEGGGPKNLGRKKFSEKQADEHLAKMEAAGGILRSDNKSAFKPNRREDITKAATPLDEAAAASPKVAEHRGIIEEIAKLKETQAIAEANYRDAAKQLIAGQKLNVSTEGTAKRPFIKSVHDELVARAKAAAGKYSYELNAAKTKTGISLEGLSAAGAYAKVKQLRIIADNAAKKLKLARTPDVNAKIVEALREAGAIKHGDTTMHLTPLGDDLKAYNAKVDETATKNKFQQEIAEDVNQKRIDEALQKKLETAPDKDIQGLLDEKDPDTLWGKIQDFLKEEKGSAPVGGVFNKAIDAAQAKATTKAASAPQPGDPPSKGEITGQLAARIAWMQAASKKAGNGLLKDLGFGDEALDRLCVWRRHFDRIKDFSTVNASQMHEDLWNMVTEETRAGWGIQKFHPGDEQLVRASSRMDKKAIMSGEEGLDRFTPEQRQYLAKRAELRQQMSDKMTDELDNYLEREGDKHSEIWKSAIENVINALNGETMAKTPVEKVLSQLTQGMYDYIFKWNPAFQVLLLHDPLIAGSSRVGPGRVAQAMKLLADKKISGLMDGMMLEDPMEQLRGEIRADQKPAETKAGKIFEAIGKPRTIKLAGKEFSTAEDLPGAKINNKIMMAAGLMHWGDEHYEGGGLKFLNELADGKISDEQQFDAINSALRITDETLGSGTMGLNKDGIASSPALRGFAMFSSQMLRVTRLAASYAGKKDFGKLFTLYGMTALMGGEAAINKEIKDLLPPEIKYPLEDFLNTFGNLPAKAGRDISDKLHMQIMSYGTNALADNFMKMVESFRKKDYPNAAWAAAMFFMPKIMGIGTGTVHKALKIGAALAAGKKVDYATDHGIGHQKILGNPIMRENYGPLDAAADFFLPGMDPRVAEIQRERRRAADIKRHQPHDKKQPTYTVIR